MNLAPGDIVLIRMIRASTSTLKLRPALILKALPGPYQQWLACGISSNLDNQSSDWDERVSHGSPDFAATGLHRESLIRLSYLQGVSEVLIQGVVGEVDPAVVRRLCDRLATHIAAVDSPPTR